MLALQSPVKSRVSPQEAARELLRRRRARESLVDYSQAITIPGAPMSDDPDEWLFKPIETAVAKHHIVTMQAIERCIRTDYGRLMIFEPPGSAKSTYASVVGTTWAMGAFPGLRVLMTSYASTPIIRHGKRARQIVGSPEYASIWPERTTLVHGSNAADEWELTNGSGLFAAGLLAGLTSSRCDLGIIDDPVAGREEAESDTIRGKTRQAYDDDFLTRLKPKASIILIQTRWHQEDLAGGILPVDYDGRSGPVKCRDGQVWEVLNIPAKCERDDDPLGREIGEYLWPEWFSERHWRIYEANPRTWASLYQQRPAPEEGVHFKREWFDRYQPYELPKSLRYYLASDFAVTEKAGDWTEHGVFGVDEDGGCWAVDWFSGQVGTDKAIAEALRLVEKWRPHRWFGEKGVIENAIGPAIKRAMREEQTFARRDLLPTIGDKVARSRGFGARAQAGTVHFPADTPWADEVLSQLTAFPAGRHDDKVDVCGLIGRALDTIVDADAEDSPEAEPKPYTLKWLESRDRELTRDRYRYR